MQYKNQGESGDKNTAVLLNKEIVLPTTDKSLLSTLTKAAVWLFSPPVLTVRLISGSDEAALSDEFPSRSMNAPW